LESAKCSPHLLGEALEQNARMETAGDNIDLTPRGHASSDEQATDESLVAEVCAGDQAAFEHIFDRHRRRVARIIGRFFNRSENVEEIIQEVFAKIYFALPEYRVERGPSFAAWVARVTINACYDELRRARRRPESSISDMTDDETAWLNSRQQGQARQADAETATISRDLANKLLARLGADDRLVLTLLDVEEMGVSDIAEAMGWTVSKVKVRAHRARNALRRIVSEYT
jgi:RNA polymerase sigma-70 factor (ECF subfamily)